MGNFKTNPFTPGFNTQVGSAWTDSSVGNYSNDNSGQTNADFYAAYNATTPGAGNAEQTSYIVTEDGKIIDLKIVPFNTTKDLLISDLTDEMMYVTPGVLTPADQYSQFYTDANDNSKSYMVDIYRLNFAGANEEASDLFKFLVENTSVEWSHFQYGENNNVISTSHQPGFDSGASSLAILYSERTSINLFEHDHPNSKNDLNYYGPSGGIMGDQTRFQENDMTQAQTITNNEHKLFPNAVTVFKVIDFYYNRIVNYDGNNINLGESKYYINGK